MLAAVRAVRVLVRRLKAELDALKTDLSGLEAEQTKLSTALSQFAAQKDALQLQLKYGLLRCWRGGVRVLLMQCW